MVKRFLKERSGDVPSGSRHLPEQTGNRPAATFDAVGRPVKAGEAEVEANPRARSATLRVARRTSASPWTGKGMPS
jgi:16S rRNA (cytosine1402-N4)-methyltransferase